jgi:hypothetical protein
LEARENIMGHKSDAKGLRYEQKVANYFTRKGWSPQFRVIKHGYEYDLYGIRHDALGMMEEHLVVECKDKDVSAKEVLHFIKKVDLIYNYLPEILFSKPALHAFICHSGKVDQDGIDVLNTHKPSIKLLRIP